MFKLSTPQQVAALRIGDTLKRFPCVGQPETLFDYTRYTETDTFEIRSIRLSNNMYGLVMCGDSVGLLPAPGDVGRLFIESFHIVKQRIWWLAK